MTEEVYDEFNLEDLLNDQLDELINETEQSVDIITFSESPTYLGLKLKPVQRFILKTFYGLPLEKEIKDVSLRQFPDNEDGTMLTEYEYLLFLMNQKRINVREPEDVEEAVQYLLLACGRRGGKCVKANTYLYTDEGMIKIGDLAKGEAPDTHSDLDIGIVQEKGNRTRTDKFYNGGVRAVSTIKTKKGYELGGTDNHRIKVINIDGNIVWKYMADMQIGDRVCINRVNNIWPKNPYNIEFIYTPKRSLYNHKNLPSELNIRWATLLGLLVGDGLWTQRDVIKLTVGDQDLDLVEFAHKLFESCFDTVRVEQSQKQSTFDIITHSVHYRAFLDHIGYTINPEEKTIPWIILRERKEIVSSFLSGLFEADGGLEKDSRVGNKRAINFCSKSEELVREVQLMLLNFGILSTKRKKYNKKYKRYHHHLYIGGSDNLKKFYNEINFLSQRKKSTLQASIDAMEEVNPSNNNQDTIPFQHNRMQKFWELNPTNRINRNLVRHVAQEKYDLSYTKLGKILDVFQVDKDHYFHYLNDCNYYYDEVVEITESTEQVYDLHVPDGNMFIANGMVNHNTFLVSIISAYEAYLLITKGNPQEYYGLPTNQPIKIMTVATNSDQATIASDAIKGRIVNSNWFKKYVEGTTAQAVRLWTKYDLANGLPPSIIVDAMSCTASGVRGHTVIVAILDEFAHFREKSGNSSGKQVYESITPSMATFRKDGKILMLSNPYAKSGHFYTMYKKGMGTEYESPVENIRVYQLPSWEMNDSIEFDYFRREYALNPDSFDYEYGAEFSSTVTGFFKFPEKIEDCIDEIWAEPIRPKKPHLHYVAIDPASVGNGYALCMVHVEEREIDKEKRNVIVVDRWKRWLVTDDEFVNIGLGIIDPSVVDDYIIDLARHFRIVKVRYDQYESASSIHRLNRAGITAERKPIGSQYNMDIYKNLRNLIYNDEIILPNVPEGIAELLNLQEKKTSKNRFQVMAPVTGDITTDDMADVLAVASFMATEKEIAKSSSQIIGINSSGAKIISTGSGRQLSSKIRQKMHLTHDRHSRANFQRGRGW